jgi:hypothetical protein
MAHRVAWSRRALQDIEAIADYIASDSATYAGIVVKKICQPDPDAGEVSSRRVQGCPNSTTRASANWGSTAIALFTVCRMVMMRL